MWNIFACYFFGATFVSMQVARELCLRTIQNVLLSSSGPLLKVQPAVSESLLELQDFESSPLWLHFGLITTARVTDDVKTSKFVDTE